MELIKENRFEFSLLLDGVKHQLDLSGINACCPNTKAILAGLKFISDDPQDYSFFLNCFGNPHAMTEFSHHIVDKNYDLEGHKQKLFKQARLLSGNLRSYFLEALLKHMMWVNESDHWTNCKYEFEKVLLPQLNKMLKDWDANNVPIETDGLKSTDRSYKLTKPQIALIHIYKGKQITRDNASEIALQYGFAAKNSGEGLYHDFVKYANPTDRKARPTAETKITFKNKIKLFSSVLPYLEGSALDRAREDLAALERLFASDYQ